jgi:hypothetical protein
MTEDPKTAEPWIPLPPDEPYRRLEGICPDCGEPIEVCQARAQYAGSCWRWNDDEQSEVIQKRGSRGEEYQ